MATYTSASLKQAFDRFIELVEPIDDVRYVVVFDELPPEIFTYISRLDEEVCVEVFHAQDQTVDDFPDLPIEFHIRYLEGRPLESFVHPLPPLVYSKDAAR